MVYPFASQKKTMTTVIEINNPTGDAGYRVHVKGASEIVLGHCTHYVDANGTTQPLSKDMKQQFDITISRFADQALRTICIAYHDVTKAEFDEFVAEDPPNEKLVCLGIFGIQDPLREGVVESVEVFRRAGVFVRMITGDNIQTAKAIAKNAGILTAGGVAMTGPEFRALDHETQMAKLPRLQVLARSSPTDKTIVVSCLKEQGDVVAVTGDGTNDGPALKLADVGFSMGIAGTEVAKEASSIILMDDNFNSIVSALKWGRAVNDSVRKFLQFQLTVNITAVVLSFSSAVISDDNESVLTAVQLLWVNLIMDTLAALALATEPPRKELLNRLPTAKTASLINFHMWKMILGQALFQIIVNLTLIHLAPAVFHLSDSKHDKAVMRTIVFNTFVFLQVFNELNCRRIDEHLNVFTNILHNYIFIIVQVVVIISQCFIVEFGGVAFSTTPLTWYQWLATVIIGSLSLPIGIVIRLLPNVGVPEHLLNEYHKPKVTYGQMQWETLRTRVDSINVIGLLRRSTRHNSASASRRENSGPSARRPQSPLPRHRFATFAEQVTRNRARA
jgi:Ca2+-transporting ATPase